MEIKHTNFDASLFWYLSLKSVLVRAGAEKSKFDDSIFWAVNYKLQGVMCCRINDFSSGG